MSNKFSLPLVPPSYNTPPKLSYAKENSHQSSIDVNKPVLNNNTNAAVEFAMDSSANFNVDLAFDNIANPNAKVSPLQNETFAAGSENCVKQTKEFFCSLPDQVDLESAKESLTIPKLQSIFDGAENFPISNLQQNLANHQNKVADLTGTANIPRLKSKTSSLEMKQLDTNECPAPLAVEKWNPVISSGQASDLALSPHLSAQSVSTSERLYHSSHEKPFIENKSLPNPNQMCNGTVMPPKTCEPTDNYGSFNNTKLSKNHISLKEKVCNVDTSLISSSLKIFELFMVVIFFLDVNVIFLIISLFIPGREVAS